MVELNGVEESIFKFLMNAFNEDLNNVDALTWMNEIAMYQWEDGKLTDSEHCDVEAWLDSKLRRL